MFNNLIESSSHRSEVKRRSYFLLVTTATYALLLALAGVASIYAYDARLKQQSTDLTLLTFAPVEPVYELPPHGTPRNTGDGYSSHIVQPLRPTNVDTVANPNNPPEQIETIAPTIPSGNLRPMNVSDFVNPAGRGGEGNGGPGPTGAIRVIPVELPTPPPPEPTTTPNRILRVSRVLNSQAITLPKPPYPAIARMAGVQGVVNVQVLIDETGKVISAKALSGSPLLMPEAVKAAYQARFSPTTIGEQPVKVSGLITYNFVLQK